MRKILLVVAVLTFSLSNAQEIKRDNTVTIWKNLSMEVKENEGEYFFFWRDARFEYINKFKTIAFSNKEEFVLFLTQCQKLIDSKDKKLYFEMNGVLASSTGYEVRLSEGKSYCYFRKNYANKILEALN